MDDEELEPRNKPAKKRDLSVMAIAELEAYIGSLEEEIGRARNEIVAVCESWMRRLSIRRALLSVRHD